MERSNICDGAACLNDLYSAKKRKKTNDYINLLNFTVALNQTNHYLSTNLNFFFFNIISKTESENRDRFDICRKKKKKYILKIS